MVATIIRDGPAYYPQSVCEYVRLRSAELRMLYARCRSREEILRGELAAAETEQDERDARVALFEVERMILFMASNCREG